MPNNIIIFKNHSQIHLRVVTLFIIDLLKSYNIRTWLEDNNNFLCIIIKII